MGYIKECLVKSFENDVEEYRNATKTEKVLFWVGVSMLVLILIFA